MKVEVLKEPMDSNYGKRMKRIVMTPQEQDLYVGCPGAARGNRNPAYPDDDYGEIGD